MVNYFGVQVPQIINNPVTDTFGKYLLLNSEFKTNTRIVGFQFYGVAPGLVNLTVFF